jgi:hypothetical protein
MIEDAPTLRRLITGFKLVNVVLHAHKSVVA